MKRLWSRYWRAVSIGRAKLAATWERHPYEDKWKRETRTSIRLWDWA